jgi:Asp/Glu/hydantoin racemase
MAETPRPARLWYQSFVHPIEQAPYIGKLQGQLDAVAAPGIKFEVRGLDPPDHLFHPLTEFRCAAQTIRNALEAERAGYDAFVIGHFQEPGLLEIRGAVDIPVIGLGEATLLAALSMGRRLGLVTIDPVFVDWHERQVRAHGLDQRVAGVRALRMDLPGFMRAFTDEAAYAKVRADFVEQVRPLVGAGAEVIIPAGGFADAAVRARMPVRGGRRAHSQWHRGGGQGGGDGARAPPAHRRGGQPARHLCKGVGRMRARIPRRPLVIPPDSPSCPALCRASTSSRRGQDVDGRDKPGGHDVTGTCSAGRCHCASAGAPATSDVQGLVGLSGGSAAKSARV